MFAVEDRGLRDRPGDARTPIVRVRAKPPRRAVREPQLQDTAKGTLATDKPLVSRRRDDLVAPPPSGHLRREDVCLALRTTEGVRDIVGEGVLRLPPVGEARLQEVRPDAATVEIQFINAKASRHPPGRNDRVGVRVRADEPARSGRGGCRVADDAVLDGGILHRKPDAVRPGIPVQRRRAHTDRRRAVRLGRKRDSVGECLPVSRQADLSALLPPSDGFRTLFRLNRLHALDTATARTECVQVDPRTERARVGQGGENPCRRVPPLEPEGPIRPNAAEIDQFGGLPVRPGVGERQPVGFRVCAPTSVPKRDARLHTRRLRQKTVHRQRDVARDLPDSVRLAVDPHLAAARERRVLAVDVAAKRQGLEF